MNCNFDLGKRLFPLLVNLVLEDELDICGVGLHCVHKEKRNFLWCEGLFPNDVVNNGL